MHRLLKKLTIAGIAVFVALLSLEFGVRIVSPQDLGFWDSHSFRRIQIGPPHFIENIPGGQARFTGVPVAINSLGFRGAEITTPKPPNTIRIMAVGDSITFGYGVSIEDTYAKALERRLNEHPLAGVRYEVLNGGTLGGSLVDYLHFLYQKAALVQPDIVLIGLCLNDILVYTQAGPISRPEEDMRDNEILWVRHLNRFVLQHSHLYTLMYSRLKSFLYGSGILDINKVQDLNFLVLSPPSDYQKKAWESSLGMLTQIATFCREHEYQLVVAAFPMQMQLSMSNLQFYREKYHLRLSDNALSGDPQRRLQEYATTTGLTLVDLLPAYRRYDPNELYLHNQMIPADPTHPSVKGNQIAADAIFLALQSTVHTGDSR